MVQSSAIAIIAFADGSGSGGEGSGSGSGEGNGSGSGEGNGSGSGGEGIDTVVYEAKNYSDSNITKLNNIVNIDNTDTLTNSAIMLGRKKINWLLTKRSLFC